MSNEGEQLLYVVSAKRSLAWAAFKRVFDQLDVAQAIDDEPLGESHTRRNKTVRTLSALGHCDFQFGEKESRVYVAPPVLVRLPQAGLPAAIMAGARSPETRPDVEVSCATNGCRLSVFTQRSDLPSIPARLLIESDTEESLHALSLSLGIYFDARPAAWLIAYWVSTLNEYLTNARWRTDGELNWPRKEFNCDRLRFYTDDPDAYAAALIRYTNPKRGNVLHFFRIAGKYSEVDCDWGRYAALREAGLNILVYDERKQLFAVPVGAPLPRLFARSLGLCSGFVPIFLPKDAAGWSSPEDEGFDVFRRVPRSIAHLVAEKLGQSLLPHPMNLTAY
jgi:hypothetical protein